MEEENLLLLDNMFIWSLEDMDVLEFEFELADEVPINEDRFL